MAGEAWQTIAYFIPYVLECIEGELATIGDIKTDETLSELYAAVTAAREQVEEFLDVVERDSGEPSAWDLLPVMLADDILGDIGEQFDLVVNSALDQLSLAFDSIDTVDSQEPESKGTRRLTEEQINRFMGHIEAFMNTIGTLLYYPKVWLK
jgi:hypothetical protein